MPDELHQRIVDEALTNGVQDGLTRFTQGELILYHTLLQDYGTELAGKDRLIPLMERNKRRLDEATDWQ